MIGIVGNGFVGNAVYQNFRDKTPCKVYDTDKNRSLNTLSEVIEQDFIFVCLPTPMRYGGECCLLYTSPSPRDVEESRMPSSA